MFGVFSLSTIGLVALYVWGFIMMMKAGLNADKGWMASAMWAAVWPLSAWKLLNDLWRQTPPVE